LMEVDSVEFFKRVGGTHLGRQGYVMEPLQVRRPSKDPPSRIASMKGLWWPPKMPRKAY
jgi:hypothetical protein